MDAARREGAREPREGALPDPFLDGDDGGDFGSGSEALDAASRARRLRTMARGGIHHECLGVVAHEAAACEAVGEIGRRIEIVDLPGK